MAPKRKRTSTSSKHSSELVESPANAVHTKSNAADPDSDEADPPAKRTASSKLDRQPVSDDCTEGAIEPKEEDVSTADDMTNGNLTEVMPAGIVDPVGYHTNPPPKGRPVRVYADGVFDLFHLGHMRQLEQAKKAFPNTILTVGVTGDTETHRRKGLTVLSAAERAETVRHCRWVDAVIEDCPWVVTAEFLAKHEFDYVAHDDLPYGADEGDDIYKPIKERGMFLVTQRTEGVSTTGIITKIVRDYENYIARQLKRGTSRKDLNISWLKKNELDLKASVKELRETIKSNWAQTGSELSKELRQFWQLSRPSSPAPGAGGPLRFPTINTSPPPQGSGSPNVSNAGDFSPATAAITPASATAHLSPLDSQARSPSTRSRASDFATGYSLGLMGGVRSWMTRNRRNVINPSRRNSSDEIDGEADGNVEKERGRGRSSEQTHGGEASGSQEYDDEE